MGSIWIPGGGGGGAPVTADYLVGTEQADLAAEIVAGAAPGGELGGTWGTPTVDVTHGSLGGSGASHTGHVVIRKAVDETVNNSAVLQNDDTFVVAVAANSVWVAELYLGVYGDTTADIQFDFTGPAGSTIHWGFKGQAITVSGAEAPARDLFGSPPALTNSGADSNNHLIILVAVISNGATPGNLTFRWAQNTATVADTKVKAGSVLVAHRIA